MVSGLLENSFLLKQRKTDMENNVEVNKKRKLSCRADDGDSQCKKPKIEAIEFSRVDCGTEDDLIVDNKKRELSREPKTEDVSRKIFAFETQRPRPMRNMENNYRDRELGVYYCNKLKTEGIKFHRVNGVEGDEKMIEIGSVNDVGDKKQQLEQTSMSKIYELTQPLLSWIFKGWDPLENASHGIDVLKPWKQAFPFTDGLLSEIVIHAITKSKALDRYHIDKWDPIYNSQPMFDFVNSWCELLPKQYIDDAILDGTVLKELCDALGRCNLRDKRNQFTHLVHLWNTFLGDKIKAKLYPLAREKLWSEFGQPKQGRWRHVEPVLIKWHNAFDFESQDWLKESIVVPQLKIELTSYNALNNRAPISYVSSWIRDIPIPLMVDLMENHFFPRWFEELDHMLLLKSKRKVHQLFEKLMKAFRLKLEENPNIQSQFELIFQATEQQIRLESRRGLQRLMIEKLTDESHYRRSLFERLQDSWNARKNTGSIILRLSFELLQQLIK